MSKKLTITVSDEIYERLHRDVGRRGISRFFDELARARLGTTKGGRRDLAAQYDDASREEEAEREAQEWIEDGVGDCLPDESFRDWPHRPPR